MPVILRSHYRILDSQEIEHLTVSQPYICEVKAGDALIMSPLILHSSLKSRVPSDNLLDNRAVIHLEYSTATLPNNLRWA